MAHIEQVLPNKVIIHGMSPANVEEVYRQVYTSEQLPVGAELIKTPVFKDEFGGHFLEVARLVDGCIKALKDKGFSLNIKDGQINAAWIVPGTERFGHLHRDQDELWVISKGTLVVALYDNRVSITQGRKSKLVLSEGMGIFIPHGVVHGFGNYSNDGVLLNYCATMQFDPSENTQEWRLVSQDQTFWDFAKPDKI